MVEHTIHTDLDHLFHALADRTRRSLLAKLQPGPKRVTDLADEYEISLNAISKHLKVLEKAKLISRQIEGREHFCLPNPSELKKAQAWLDAYTVFWEDKLDRLDDYISKKEE